MQIINTNNFKYFFKYIFLSTNSNSVRRLIILELRHWHAYVQKQSSATDVSAKEKQFLSLTSETWFLKVRKIAENLKVIFIFIHFSRHISNSSFTLFDLSFQSPRFPTILEISRPLACNSIMVETYKSDILFRWKKMSLTQKHLFLLMLERLTYSARYSCKVRLRCAC